jgi:hypothetical protein
MPTAAVDDLQMGLRKPPDDCTTCLGKPFDIDVLLAAIRGVIATCNEPPVAV